MKAVRRVHRTSMSPSRAHLGLIQPRGSGVAPKTLHPILALDHVIDECRDYLRTEFRAKDKALPAALERELDRPLFLAQEPFYRAHRPFKLGKRWRDLPIDAKLARVMEDRGTSQARRDEMRKNPPHLLLTNYMMLEYLLTRPADREDIFADHRCRFLVHARAQPRGRGVVSPADRL